MSLLLLLLLLLEFPKREVKLKSVTPGRRWEWMSWGKRRTCR